MNGTKNYSKQVFIVGEGRDGTMFDIHIDIGHRRSYTLKKFIDHYTSEFFGMWTAPYYTLVVREPRDATLTFHYTEKGRELATMFKLGHDCLSKSILK